MPQSSQSAPDDRLRFVPAGLDDPLAQPLLDQLAVDYAQRYGRTSQMYLDVDAQRSRPTSSHPLTAGCSSDFWMDVRSPAVRSADSTRDTAELKRIWTDREHRRRGYAMALLAELEAQIAARGYRKVYLVTGDRQPEAEELYRTAGYTRLPGPLPARGPVLPIAFEKGLV